MKYILPSILTVFSLFPVISVAQESLVTDRPDFVESSSVVNPGMLQVEGSFATDRTSLKPGNIENMSTPFLFRLGIFPDVEARLESDWYTRRTTNGLQSRSGSVGGVSDMSIGIKWAFSAGDEDIGQPAMAALVHADFPTGSQEFKGSGIRPSLRISAEWNVRMPWEDPTSTDKDWGVGVMPGVMLDRNERDDSFYSGIFGFVISKGILIPDLRAFTEVAFEQVQSVQNGGSLGFIQAGSTYLLNPSWQLDAAFAIGITENASDLGFTIGLSGFLLD